MKGKSLNRKANYSACLLGVYGAILLGIGIFFVLFRPALLPEDIKFMELSELQLQTFKEHSAPWLKQVFRVLGGYIFSSGTLFIYLAYKPFRMFESGSWTVAFIAGLSSIGIMTAVNFKIGSDFKWLLVLLSLIWMSSLILNLIAKRPSIKNQ